MSDELPRSEDGEPRPRTAREVRWAVSGIVERVERGDELAKDAAKNLLDWLNSADARKDCPGYWSTAIARLLSLLQKDQHHKENQKLTREIASERLDLEREKVALATARLEIEKQRLELERLRVIAQNPNAGQADDPEIVLPDWAAGGVNAKDRGGSPDSAPAAEPSEGSEPRQGEGESGAPASQ